MTFVAPGSENRRGPYESSRQRARFSAEFIAALLRDFRQGGPAAIAKVRKHQPAAYMKICALLVPREMKVDHSAGLSAMTDEHLEDALTALREILARGKSSRPASRRKSRSGGKLSAMLISRPSRDWGGLDAQKIADHEMKRRRDV